MSVSVCRGDGPGSAQWCWAIGQEAETNAEEVPLEHEEELYCASDQALEQRGCGISFTGNIQEPFGCAMCPTMTLLKQED